MSSTDLTAAARIRDAAIEVFAQEGFAQATVRAIAARAGVSPGLVIHHFGSKHELRLACDRQLLASASGEKLALIAGGHGPRLAGYLIEHPEVAGQLAYLSRAMSEGGDLADQWFDVLVEHTTAMLAAGQASGAITGTTDPVARTAVLVAQSLATLVFAPQLARHLGASDLTDPVAYERLGRTVLELYSDGFLTGSRGADHD